MRLSYLQPSAAIAVAAAFPALADSITIYSQQGDQRAVWIAEQGKAAGHDIRLLNAGGGELFYRLIAEKNKPQADIEGRPLSSLFAVMGEGPAGVGAPVKVDDTEGGTPVISEGVTLMAGTDQLDRATAFVDWWASADVMAACAEKFGQTAVLPAALAKSPAEVQANAKLVKAQPIDWEAIAPKLEGGRRCTFAEG